MLPLRNIKRFIAKAVKQPGYALRVFLKRSHAYLYYRLARGKSSPPEAITFFLTHKCNLHCKMCGQWGEGGVTKKEGAGFVEQELSLGTIQALLDEVSGFYPNITLFGGEPLLYKNIIQVIRSIKSRSLHCLMITNGSLIYGYARELVEAGLDELNISLDGKSQLHDDIRQMPGLYERITLGIKKVNQIKKELRCNKPLINLQCTVNRDNYLRLEEMVEVADELGADSLTYHNLIFTTTKVLAKQKEADIKLDASSKDWEGFAFASGIDAEALFNKFKLIAAIPHKFNIDFYPNFSSKALIDYYNNPDYIPKGYPCRCLSPWVVAYIFPDGKIKPCLNSSYSFGDITKIGFMQAWNSPEAIRFRRLLKSKGIFPACVRCTELYRY